MADLTELRAQVEILRWCKNRRAELADIEQVAKEAIQEALGDDESGTLDGEAVVTWKSHKRNALDQKLLRKLHPEAAAECMSASVVRRFEVLG